MSTFASDGDKGRATKATHYSEITEEENAFSPHPLHFGFIWLPKVYFCSHTSCSLPVLQGPFPRTFDLPGPSQESAIGCLPHQVEPSLIEAKAFQGSLHFNKNEKLLDSKEWWHFRHSFQVEEELSRGLFCLFSKPTLVFLHE